MPPNCTLWYWKSTPNSNPNWWGIVQCNLLTFRDSSLYKNQFACFPSEPWHGKQILELHLCCSCSSLETPFPPFICAAQGITVLIFLNPSLSTLLSPSTVPSKSAAAICAHHTWTSKQSALTTQFYTWVFRSKSHWVRLGLLQSKWYRIVIWGKIPAYSYFKDPLNLYIGSTYKPSFRNNSLISVAAYL